MKLNLLSVLLLIVVGALLFFGADQGCRKLKFKKEARLNLELAKEYKAQFENCVNTEPVVIVKDSIVEVPGEIEYKPYPYKVVIHDTILVPYKETNYDTTFKYKGLMFRWRAHVLGTIDEIHFSDFVIPYRLRTEYKTVDTCLFKPPEILIRPKTQWGAYISLFGNSFTKMPGVDAGIWVTVRGKWGFKVGPIYNTYHNELYGNIGVLINF